MSTTEDTDELANPTPGFWLRLQIDHDLMKRRRELGPALDRIEPRAA